MFRNKERWTLQEELFHAYQNYTVPGGTAQYLGSTPGHANIEFEAKVARDIMQYIDQISGGDAVPDPNYTTWIEGSTNNFTKYPTSFSSSMQSSYYTYMAEFVQGNPGYSSTSIDPTMTPISLINLSNSSNCPK